MDEEGRNMSWNFRRMTRKSGSLSERMTKGSITSVYEKELRKEPAEEGATTLTTKTGRRVDFGKRRASA